MMGYTWEVKYWDYRKEEYVNFWGGASYEDALKEMDKLNKKGWLCICLIFRGHNFMQKVKGEKESD